ncbi:MAG: hypothetical protein E6L00_03180 [Thaumarchaeota archaeon]|nr:MAG: hypothetical protein E6L02_01635 [Nitrososphaerota archaeon]TLX82576.1 MAG: hypothetical protein E6L00_03180 [Nitrososphaerota archaeon]
MSSNLIRSVLYLIESKKGDVGRLNYILNTLQDGKSLFTSDKKYLDTLISTYIDSAKRREIGISTGNDPIDELRSELKRVNEKLVKLEKGGYKKHIGQKAIFFFVTFFVSWHAIIQIINKISDVTMMVYQNTQDLNPYVFPLYQLKVVIPSQFGVNVDLGILYVWSGMMITWVVLGFIYLVKFIRSTYNPTK